MLLSLAAVPVVRAQADQAQLPSQLDLKSFPATAVDKVIVPNPDEVFSLMNKLPGQPDWASEVRRNFELKKSTDRTELALLFGSLIADGFIAVQAKDVEGVKQAGREILRLAEDLSLQNAVFPHTQSIIQATDRQDWDLVREELDRTHKTVRDLMEQMRDGDLAQCVSIAGWIRGTEVLTSLIGDAYSPEKAEILNQPDLAAHFVKQLRGMGSRVNSKPAIQSILKGLQEVNMLMSGNSEQDVPRESVGRIHEICVEILSTIAPQSNQ